MNLKKNAFCKAMKNTSDEPVSLVVKVPGQERLIRVIQPGEVYGIGQLDPSVVDEEDPIEEPICHHLTFNEFLIVVTTLSCALFFVGIALKTWGG